MDQTAAAPPSPAFEEIAETFAFLDDWEDRYRHVIELGRAMPPLEDAFRVPATKVEGCASQVWILPEVEGTGPGAVVRFRGESDAMIVRGLIAILHALYSGRPAADILKVDARVELDRLGLSDHLSSQRSNGLKAMVARIRQIAAAEAAG
ncbi:MAG: SufE family protein [Rhodobacteraceae bacterium]|jgi:cysteine desulfuration protein SufE|nr:SufE family protein [Paracoccaceae bacterium]